MTEQQPKRGRGRPVTTGVTPIRHLRIGSTWDEAAALAKQRGEKMADVARPILEQGLREYIEKYRQA